LGIIRSHPYQKDANTPTAINKFQINYFVSRDADLSKAEVEVAVEVCLDVYTYGPPVGHSDIHVTIRICTNDF
jgi:hypothetical protein